MIKSSLALLAFVAGHAPLAAAQINWDPAQINTTICLWQQPRAAVIRDTVYIDGGYLWWMPGYSNGTYGTPQSDYNPLGYVYTFNFSQSFNSSSNTTALLTAAALPKGGGGAANNIFPNYVDGGMLANNYEWFTYGGLLRKTDQYTYPAADQVLQYEKYSDDTSKTLFTSGFLNANLGSNLTRYLAYGGAASAPSEDKAWYFSGLQSPNGSAIYMPTGNKNLTAYTVSNTLIQVDMKLQGGEVWTNKTLPSSIPGRANPELVWVPVGSQGILVALGGVVNPDFIEASFTSANATNSQLVSPGFMHNINVYDIASDTWYTQPTSGGPGQMTRGCAVVATAQDMSSYNIYYYGGYDGLDETQGFKDDVWILSLPSFMWMKLKGGTPQHGRAGHKCFMPYPDQMIVFGGYTNLTGAAPPCVQGGVMQVFNLTSGAWLNGYDPSIWNKYGVPEMIYDMVGGTSTGGATITSPSPTGWSDPALGSVFAVAYPTSKISTYYPYGTAASGSNTNPNAASNGASSGGGVPKFLPPLLGVILGLLFVTFVVIGVMLWRRRRYLRKNAMSEAGTEETNGGRIASWVRQQRGGQTSEAKAMTTTTEETVPMSPEMESVSSPSPAPFGQYSEMMDTQIHRAELMDTSAPIELHDTPLTHAQVVAKHFGPDGSSASLSNPSYYSGMTQTDHLSTISHSTAGGAPGNGTHSPVPMPALPEQYQYQHQNQQQYPTAHTPQRADSPPLGVGNTTDLPPHIAAAAVSPPIGSQSPPMGAANMASGVSGISERDRAHLRQISDTTVSSVTSGVGGSGHAGPQGESIAGQVFSPTTVQSPAVMSPLSPPSAGPGGLGGGGATGSPLRRSVFRESREDMGVDGEGSGR